MNQNNVLAFCEGFSESCERYPEFYSKINTGTNFDRRGRLVFTKTHGYGVIMFYRDLLENSVDFPHCERSDFRQVAESISTLIGGVLIDWTLGECRTGELRARIMFRTTLLFRGLQRTDA